MGAGESMEEKTSMGMMRFSLFVNMQRRFWQVFTSLREQTCVSYAKIATIGGFCDLDLLVVKATSPDDLPLPERYVHDFLKIFSISPSSYRAFALSFTRRFGKTVLESRTKLLDEALDCLTLGSKQYEEEEEVEEHEEDEEQEEEPESFPHKMKELGEMLEVMPQVQSLMDRVMDCRPTEQLPEAS
ncbi:hypothetical protein RJ639_023656 [Escallonia herrerae]|uniref:Uncharacterized protein n=1 Tax=Escallonia herrerae TaxID=1293975 RepID=A0AA88V276_9ASTE|nr:hypothetical protein RJ639_023656 [Escallonia herrerae]